MINKKIWTLWIVLAFFSHDIGFAQDHNASDCKASLEMENIKLLEEIDFYQKGLRIGIVILPGVMLLMSVPIGLMLNNYRKLNPYLGRGSR